MAEKFGSDQQQLANSGGSVISQDNAVLINGDSDGEEALLFGPAALREIQTGVANGDFSIPPSDSEAVVTADNDLPYWTFTDVNSAGAITCSIVTDASAASGTSLRFSITAGTANSRSVTLRRFVPVASTRNRAFAYQPELNTFGATNTANSTIRMQSQFYEADQTTTTGSVIDTGVVTFATLGTGTNAIVGTLTTANAAPSDAAFCLITITVATAAAGTVVASTVDIPEVRLIRGDQTNIFAEYRDPATYAPTYVRQRFGELQISPNAASGNTRLGGNLSVDGGTIDTDVNLTLDVPSGSVIVKGGDNAPRVQFVNASGTNLGGLRMGTTNNFAFLNGTSADDYAYVLAERFYPMDGTSGSRYIFDNGTQTAFSGAVLAGAITSTGNVSANQYSADSITGTTATTNAAIWVLTAGTTYNLRRNTSSARYKTNIVDADEAVLQAARKIKPRHYESTIADEAGATRLGFIAEEVEAAGLTHAVGYNAEGQVETLDPTALIAALFARVNDLEERLKTLEGA